MKKYQTLTTYDLRLLAEKLTKFPNVYTIFARKMTDYIIKKTRSRPGRGQMFEAEAKAEAKL